MFGGSRGGFFTSNRVFLGLGDLIFSLVWVEFIAFLGEKGTYCVRSTRDDVRSTCDDVRLTRDDVRLTCDGVRRLRVA